MKNFVGLIILDGFGLSNKVNGNAVKLADPVNFYHYFTNYPSTTLEASGKYVGLPEGQMGNSEVGHLNIGAGRIVFQSLEKINNSIINGSFFENDKLIEVINHVKNNESTLHVMGLLSDGGVHSHINHLFALLKLAKQQNVKQMAIHVFLDGRDTLRDSGIKYVEKLINELKNYPNYKIASVMGRAYAMDREQNYDKTLLAYNAIVYGDAEDTCNDVLARIKNSYRNNVFDEFIKPVVLTENGKPVANVNDNDGIIFYNFREDRARQLTASLVEEFNLFERKKINNLKMCTFTRYDADFKNTLVAFEKEDLSVNLSSVISKNLLKQFKVAETTKYAHVTYFLNGGREDAYGGEERFLIETIKNVPFDQKPEMRAVEITSKAIQEIITQKYSFMALNYSNPDMIGHTGNLEAAIKAIKVVDVELKRLVDAILSIGGTAVIVADHGNAEEMIGKNGEVLTSHTINKVPFVIVSNPKLNISLKDDGVLGNVAPTILQLLNITQPKEFELNSLIK